MRATGQPPASGPTVPGAPGAPGAPGGITSRRAAKARFRIAAHQSPEARLLRLGCLGWAAVVMLVPGTLALHRHHGAGIPLTAVGTLLLLSVAASAATGPWRTRRHQRNLALVRLYDSRRGEPDAVHEHKDQP